jgi:SNARE protein 1
MRTASERLVAAQILSPGSAGAEKNDKSKDTLLYTQSKYAGEVRSELLSTTRRKKLAAESSDDADIVLSFHREQQEKVAMEMVSLAHNLKQNMTTASQILQHDVKVLDGASRHADSNLSGLRQNSDRLTDFVRRSCQYWLWISLVLVCASFLWIVMFIRMFPKRI